tara:strand:+ start:808 stop:960 length:153 start_codon:yes stop_codon:yes gene_type:complete
LFNGYLCTSALHHEGCGDESGGDVLCGRRGSDVLCGHRGNDSRENDDLGG